MGYLFGRFGVVSSCVKWVKMKDKKIDREKYASIGHVSQGYRTSKKKWVHDGDTSGSFQTEHWDGRRDATIRPPSVTLKAGIDGPNID